MLRVTNGIFSVALILAYLLGGSSTGGKPGLSSLLPAQTQTFSPSTESFVNPLMGWAPWASSSKIKQPHSLVYMDLSWRDLEPQEGVFDFASFEAANKFTSWRAQNKRAVFRFYLDTPGDAPHMDIPDWLYTAIGGDGDHYNNSYGVGFSPNYANTKLIAYHKKVISALGQRYAKDGFIAFIELGSLGHWAEWHVNHDEGVRRLPLANVRDQYVKHYIDAFPNTMLLMRRPFAIAKQYNLGVFNDMIGNASSTASWLDWIANGGTYNETGEVNGMLAMPDGWKVAPMGGEQTGSVSDETAYSTKLASMIQQVRDSHTTFIGPNGPYKQAMGGPLQAGIDQVLANMGYRLYIKSVSAGLPIAGTSATVAITFGNEGVAPFYQNWPTQVYLYDETGELVKTVDAGIDLRRALPGVAYTAHVSVPLDGLTKGTYSFGFAVLDPATNQPGVKLAMNNTRTDNIQAAGAFRVYDVGDIIKLFLPLNRR